MAKGAESVCEGWRHVLATKTKRQCENLKVGSERSTMDGKGKEKGGTKRSRQPPRHPQDAPSLHEGKHVEP